MDDEKRQKNCMQRDRKEDLQELVSRTGLVPAMSARLMYPSLLLVPLLEGP
jgi:hypothetical protein